MQMPDGWARGFEFRRGHGCSTLVFVVCCVGSGHCYELINHPAESDRVCPIVCDLETPKKRRPRPDVGCCAKEAEMDAYLPTA